VRVEARVKDPFSTDGLEEFFGDSPPPGMGRSSPRALIKVATAGARDLVLRLRASTGISVEVKGPDGAPVSPVRVVVSAVDREGVGRLEHHGGATGPGSSWIDGIFPGRYRVFAIPADETLDLSPMVEIEIGPDATAKATLEVTRVAPTDGRAEGERVEGKWAVWMAAAPDASPLVRYGKVGVDGRFEIHLPTGIAGRLLVGGGADDRYAVREGVRAGEPVVVADWREGRAIRGSVTGLSPHEPPWTLVSAAGEVGTLWARLDSEGRFEFRGVPPGRYSLGVRYEPAPRGNERTTGRLTFGPTTTATTERVEVEAGASDVEVPMPTHMDPGPPEDR
jgi:hypothetical protein